MRIIRVLRLVPVGLVLVTGCAYYNRAAVEPVAMKNAKATAVTATMCSDFAQVSKDLQQGPDSAWPVVGKASDIKTLSEQTAKQGIACSEAVRRGPDVAKKALPGLTSTWENVLKIVGQ